MGNAAKFTQNEHIKSSDFPMADPGAFDSAVAGIGLEILSGKQSYPYQTFTQTKVSITRLFGTAKPGLNIARRVVRFMDGSVWLKTVLYHQATVRFRSLRRTAMRLLLFASF